MPKKKKKQSSPIIVGLIFLCTITLLFSIIFLTINFNKSEESNRVINNSTDINSVLVEKQNSKPELIEDKNSITNAENTNEIDKNNPIIKKTIPNGPKKQENKPPLSSNIPKFDVYIVIDDAGYNLDVLKPFLSQKASITVAVLPGLAYSRQSADMIRNAGHEVILHQPLEALDGRDPGPGLIRLDMGSVTNSEIIVKNIESIGPIKGINNHMGSLGSEQEDVLISLFNVLKTRDLYFLDSKTSADSKAPFLAKKLGVPVAERNIFLDNENSKEAITTQFEKGFAIARKYGQVIMIGHVWNPLVAELISEFSNSTDSDEFKFRHMSEFWENMN